jgi:hypothetical protein
MRIIKKVFGFAWLGWARITLGVSRLGYRVYQAGITANYFAGKRARSLGAKR